MLEKVASVKGIVFNVQQFSLHDGPGIRTLVFLKGCPLHCQWCDNPESSNSNPELGFIRSRCNKCGKCVVVCPEQCISLDSEGMPHIDRSRCTNCGDCTRVCFPKALIIYGQERSAGQVCSEVKRDRLFFEGSGGGVTVTGGEPLRQSSFVKALFELCHEAGINTCVETSGFVSRQALEEILPLTDHMLFDLKHLDSEVHQRLTGMPNESILENARVVVERGVPTLFRSPLIPDINDTLENIKATAHFIKSLQGDKAAFELLPYHRMGIVKYQALDKAYLLEGLEALLSDSSRVKSVQAAYESMGVQCNISI